MQGNRDMFWSIVVLMLVCLVFAAIGGYVTFGQPKPGPVPEFDSHHALSEDARTLDFPVREPELPADWQSNSGRLERLGNHDASVVGWVTPSNTYVELIQTSADAQTLQQRGEHPRPEQRPMPLGGEEWTIYSGEDARDMWVLDEGDVRIAVSGQAGQSDFETMAEAAAHAEPLPAS